MKDIDDDLTMSERYAATEALCLQLAKADARCARTTGLESYAGDAEDRKVILRQLEAIQPLTRWQHICLHGYEDWRRHCREHHVPESHPLQVEEWLTRVTKANHNAAVIRTAAAS